MKQLKDIENISIEQLEALAQESDASLSQEGCSRLETALACAMESEGTVDGQEVRKPFWRGGSRWIIASVAASWIAVALVFAWRNRTPQDSFTNPYEAYEALQDVLAKVSSSASYGLEVVEENTDKLSVAGDVIDKVNRKISRN